MEQQQQQQQQYSQLPPDQQMLYHQYMQMNQYQQQNPSTPAAYGYPPTYNPQQPYPPPYSYPKVEQQQQQQQQYPYGSQQVGGQSFPNYLQYQGLQQQPNISSSSGHSDKTLWIGNLHQEVTELELRQHFEKYGNIENIKLVHTKACGFVTFTEPRAATQAHTEMNRRQIHGQEIKVGWGKAENTLNQFPGGGGGYGPGGYGMSMEQRIPDINKELPHMEPSRSIWIGNVTANLNEQVLRTEFGRFGNIDMVRIMLQKNCAFITFTNTQDATQAKNYMDKKRILDTQIRVNFGKA